MEIILIIKKEDINTSKIGLNFQIETKSGIKIIFQNDAIIELIEDYEVQKNSEKVNS